MVRGIAAVVASAAVVAGTANAAAMVRVGGSSGPSLPAFALAPADFDSGASVERNITTSAGGLPAYVRVFRPGARLAGSRLSVVVSLVMLEQDAPSAAGDFAQVSSAAHSAAGRAALAKEFGLDFVKGLSMTAAKNALIVKKTLVGAPIEVGGSAFRLPLTMATNRGSLHMSIGFAQGDRIVSEVLLMAPADLPVSSSAQTRALAALQHHLQVGFTITNAAAPTITGTAAQGQTLTADPGVWAGSPSSLTYAWSRCDTSATNCSPIEGASGPSYLVAAADAGFTLRLTVSAANSISTAQSLSAATAPVG